MINHLKYELNITDKFRRVRALTYGNICPSSKRKRFLLSRSSALSTFNRTPFTSAPCKV